MGNWVTSLGLPEVFEGLLCCTTSSLSAVCSRCSTGYPRFAFSLYFIFGTVACFLVLSPGMRPLLDKIPYFCTAVTTEEMCDTLVGYGAVYRICFSLGMFYVIFALLMFNTTSTNDFRLRLHNGYWFLKLVLLVLVFVIAFHIPRHTEFGRMLMYAGLIGGFMFTMIQILLIIDFAHSWSISWAEKVDTGNTTLWYTALAFSTILIYSVSITMGLFFYLFFTDLRDLTKCRGNMFLISFNLAHCMLASLISVLPRVQDEAQGSGLLQSSVVTLYTMYLTWCTLSSEPEVSCNPLGDVILEYDKASGVNGQAVFDCVLMFALLIYACNVRSDTSRMGRLGFSLSKITMVKKYGYIDNCQESTLNSRHKNVASDDFVEYNYSCFHFVMFLASLQLMMVVTNWHSPDEMANMKKLVKNWATVWIQLSSSFLCALLYIWAIVAPLMLRTWGSCFGLDYESVPTEDDYDYDRPQGRTDAKYTRDDVHKGTKSGERFVQIDKDRPYTKKRGKSSEKFRQSVGDSGMFDTNATRSHLRSESRASVRPASAKSIYSEVYEESLREPSKNTKAAALGSLSISVEKLQPNRSRERLERPQSNQSSAAEICSDADPTYSSGSPLYLAKSDKTAEVNETSRSNAYPEARHLTMEINDGNFSFDKEEDDVNYKENSLENVISNAQLATKTTHSTISLNRSHNISTTFSRSNFSDESCSSDPENVIERGRKKSSDVMNVDDWPLSRIKARPPSSAERRDNKQTRNGLTLVEEHQKRSPDLTRSDQQTMSVRETVWDTAVENRDNSSPNSRATVICRSRLSDVTDIARLTSKTEVSNQTVTSDGRGSRLSEKTNGTSRLMEVNNDSLSGENLKDQDGSSDRYPESRRHSSETIGYERTTDEVRPISLEMQDHMQRVKSSGKTECTFTDLEEDSTADKTKQSQLRTDQTTSVRNDSTRAEVCRTETSSKREQLLKEGKATEHKQCFKHPKLDGGIRGKDSIIRKANDSISDKLLAGEQRPTCSTRGVQPPEVAKEILRIQSKILKFQAKVVKTQQKILQMQDEDKKGVRQTPRKSRTS